MKNKEDTSEFGQKLSNYIKAAYPLLWVKSHEESRVVKEVIKSLSGSTTPVIIYSWDAQNHLVKLKADNMAGEKVPGLDTGVQNIVTACRKLGSQNERSIIVLKDFHHYIEAPGAIRAIRNAVADLKLRGNMILFVSPVIKIPVELEKEIQLLDFPLPGIGHIGKVLDSIRNEVHRQFADSTREEDKICSVLSPEVRQAAMEAAQGMTHSEVQDAYSLAYVGNGQFNNDFVLTVFEEKVKQVKKHGLLQYVKPDATFNEIGGLDGLKKWIRSRAKAYSQAARDYNLPYPRGILLAGVPGGF